MSKHKDYWDKLQAAILINHKCKATFRKTVFIREKTPEGDTLWEGDVEIFDLIEHEEADICYAWQQIDGGDELKIFTILGNQFIYSANKAVQMALFMDPEAAVRTLRKKFAGHRRMPVEVP